MRPSRRFGANKRKSARRFRKNARRTKAPNMAPPPQRGGYRF